MKEKRMPAVILIEELEKETGASRQELRPWLLELYREERIECGRTLNGAYVTTKTHLTISTLNLQV